MNMMNEAWEKRNDIIPKLSDTHVASMLADRALATMKDVNRRSHRACLLGLDGPPASGKSSLMKLVAEELVRRGMPGGRRVHIVTIDHFLHKPERRKSDGVSKDHYENTVDHTAFRSKILKHILEIGSLSKAIEVATRQSERNEDPALRTFYEQYDIRPYDLVLIEGVYLFHEELKNSFDEKWILEADEDTLLSRAKTRAIGNQNADGEGLTGEGMHATKSEEEVERDQRERFGPGYKKYHEKDQPRKNADVRIRTHADGTYDYLALR